jgi:hypothetical protein
VKPRGFDIDTDVTPEGLHGAGLVQSARPFLLENVVCSGTTLELVLVLMISHDSPIETGVDSMTLWDSLFAI